MTQPTVSVTDLAIADLWSSGSLSNWNARLDEYWRLVQPRNVELERVMEHLSLDRIRAFDAEEWFKFLHDDYFRWKYTAPNRYATTTGSLRRKMPNADARQILLRIRDQLLRVDASNIRAAVELGCRIPGLGTAGASGLLALMYPQSFGTVDQFVVKALRQVPEFSANPAIAKMKPEGLTSGDADLLIRIMRRKASNLTEGFGVPWTPRMVDKVLWTYGRN